MRSVFKCMFSSTCVDYEGSRLCSVPFVFLRIFRVYCFQCVLLWLYDRLSLGELIETVMRFVSPSG